MQQDEGTQKMKPVLPRLAEFGTELTDPDAQRTHGNKRTPNRPNAPHKPAHWGDRVNETLPELASPSTINITCTAMKEQCGQAEEEHRSRKGPVFAYEELRQLQNLWESQKHPKLTTQLSHFTVVGQGATGAKEKEVFLVKDVPGDVPTDGNTEWTAVSWKLPRHRDAPVQLACLLFCKGVARAELPRVSIFDWKSGTLGIPTFHCERCLKRWFKSGNLPVECLEPEEIIEGPAMCITLSDQGSSEFILNGIVGQDGKPVRVKVKNRKGIRKLLKQKKWNKKGGEGSKQRQGHSRRRKKAIASHARRSGNGADSSVDESEGSISSSVDDNSVKGESSKHRQGRHHTRKKKKQKGSHARRNGNGVDSSMGESEDSISSSADGNSDKGESCRRKRRRGHSRKKKQKGSHARRNGNGVDSSGDESEGSISSSDDDHDDKGESCKRKRRRGHSRRRKNARRNASMDDDSISSSDDESDDIIDLPKHFRNHFLKKKKSKKSTSQGCYEDGSSDHSSSSMSVSSSFDSDDEATRQYSRQSHHHHHRASQKHGKHGKRRNKQRHQTGNEGISSDDDDTCTTSSESELEGSSNDLHRSRTRARRRQKRSNKNDVEDDDSHFPPIPDSRRRNNNKRKNRLDSTLPDINDDSKQEDRSKRRAVRRDTLTDTTATDLFQLPSIAEASHRIHSQSDARHPKPSSRHRLSDVQHLPQLTPGHVHMMQQGSNGDMSGSDSYVDPAARSRRTGQLASTHPHGVSLHDSMSSNTQKSSTSRRGSMMNYMESKSGSSGNKPQRDSTTLSDKTATVQQDVQLPVKRQNKGHKKGKRNKPLNVSEHLSQIQATKTGRNTAGQEIARFPDDEKTAGQEIVRLPDEQTNNRVDFQQLQAQEDNHARRIGRKIVKKTRNTSHQLADKRMTINHNSKDMGNITEPQQDDDDMPIDGSVTTDRNGMQRLEMIPSAEEVDQSSAEKYRANLFSNTTRRTSFGPISGKTSMSQLQQQAQYNSMPSSSSNQTEVEYLSSGLGSKFTSNYKPARLTPLEEPVNKLSLEFTVGKRPNIVIPPLGQEIEPTLMPTDDPKSPHHHDEEQEAPSDHCKPEGDDSGLEVSTEEDESNDEEILFPLLDLKPISGLSFTSPFSYSTFPMAVQYREAYEIVQRKALVPVRYGRVKAAKVTRKRRQ